MLLVIDRPAQVRCHLRREIDLAALGSLSIARASHVEPDDQGQWFADLGPGQRSLSGAVSAIAAKLWLPNKSGSKSTGLRHARAADVHGSIHFASHWHHHSLLSTRPSGPKVILRTLPTKRVCQ